MVLTSPTVVERTRSKHEEIERLERLVMRELERPSCGNLLLQGHRLRRIIKCIMRKTERLVETFEDTVKEIEDEIAPPSRDALSIFRDRLQEIQKYHHKDDGYGSGPVDAMVPPRMITTYKSQQSGDGGMRIVLFEEYDEDYQALVEEEPIIDFSFTGEERFGRCLDLGDMYNQYINSEFGERVEYSAYLDVFSQPEKIPPQLKLSSQYKKYMEALLEYLTGFLQRTQPLKDLDIILSKVENEVIPSQQTVIDLDCYTTVEELIHAWPAKLKEALEALGLKTDGIWREGAERLFRTKLEKLDKKKRFGKDYESAKEDIAVTEAKVKKLCNLLDETIRRTRQKVEEKQAEEMEENELSMRCYAMLGEKVPSGWDGIPIPYLLYKFRDDLGQEFKCEMICGEKYSYWGRRAFERHFNECRHLSRLELCERKQEYRPIEITTDYSKTTIIPPPPEIRGIIEKTAQFVLRNGIEFEKIKEDIARNAKFSFLRESDIYHAFYKLKLAEYYQDGRGTEPTVPDPLLVPDDEDKVVPSLPKRHKYSVTRPHPKGITAEQLHTIMLTAQFTARYGQKFVLDLIASDDIMDSPSFVLLDTRDEWYRDLVVAYYHVVNPRPPAYLKENLISSAADMTTVLERCFLRLQWTRFQEKETRQREEQRERDRKWVCEPRPMVSQETAPKKPKLV